MHPELIASNFLKQKSREFITEFTGSIGTVMDHDNWVKNFRPGNLELYDSLIMHACCVLGLNNLSNNHDVTVK